MSKIGADLIKAYHSPTRNTEVKAAQFSYYWIIAILLLMGISGLAGPKYAILVVGPFSALYLLIKWLSTPDRPESIGEISVEFRKDGIHVQAKVDHVAQFKEKIKLSDVRQVHGYIQDGWLLVRERGLLIETKQDQQFRLVLNLDQQALKEKVEALQLELGEMGYNFGRLRKFQP